MTSTGASTADIFKQALGNGTKQPPASTAPASGGHVGGFLVCLDVPEATEFGIDYEVFRTGPKFQGVKFVPLGVHFVVFRSREQEHGIRQGFFVNIERHGQVVVREWSAEKEELGPPRPGLNVEHLERAVLSFQLDSGLGPYPKQHAKVWQRLSKYISTSVLQRCGVDLGSLILPGDVEDAQTAAEDGGVIPFFPDLPRTIRFTRLMRRNTAEMTVQERTAYHFDKSAMVLELLSSVYQQDWKELLGELQLAFIAFLQLSSLTAMEQWKQMLLMLCSCEQALTTHVELFRAFLKLLRTQLEQIPVDFFQDELTGDNFLRPCMASLLELLRDAECPPELGSMGEQLTGLLQSRFHLDLGTELLDDDEFAPVVVAPDELDADAANMQVAMSFLRPRQ
ncbi:hypothetical protein Poli38472_004552 [Pythium oligandrum]|uniref:AAR2 protein n=1 Tax=Pythium oligandrum TaxID=41045 RepID=A0A8K1CB86_PYTOL|nr:hypothetical protein Poli38472_004552 [Pythium oligandrum]|eukprot:TMW59483.1 hypothetical protein Poli38472_004552 [Pythium oligandrum]